MAATNEQIQQAVESFFLLFNAVAVFCKLLKNKKKNQILIFHILVMSCGYTLIESGGVRSQNAGHSLFKTLLILSKLNLII
jgi:hypothetical protein